MGRFVIHAEALQDELLKSFDTSIESRIMNQGEITMKNATAVRDHVCGMDIETSTAAGRTEYKGQTYYFCGSSCKEKFDLNPEQYLGKSAATQKCGHGCCG
jgi:YHS domain-containing protein